MDKLGTYALVAALKEISKKSNPQPNTNERWVSLRNCMKDLPQTSIEPTVCLDLDQGQKPLSTMAEQPILSTAPRMSTTPPSRNFSHIRAIDQRHQNARKTSH